MPEDAIELSHQFGFAEPEKVGENYQEALQYPTLNVRGLRAAWTGDAVRTIIPDVALAEIDVRLVPESDGERLMQSIRRFIQDLRSEGISLEERILRRMIRQEVNRTLNDPPVYDLEFDTVLKEAISLLNGGARPEDYR